MRACVCVRALFGGGWRARALPIRAPVCKIVSRYVCACVCVCMCVRVRACVLATRVEL